MTGTTGSQRSLDEGARCTWSAAKASPVVPCGPGLSLACGRRWHYCRSLSFRRRCTEYLNFTPTFHSYPGASLQHPAAHHNYKVCAHIWTHADLLITSRSSHKCTIQISPELACFCSHLEFKNTLSRKPLVISPAPVMDRPSFTGRVRASEFREDIPGFFPG